MSEDEKLIETSATRSAILAEDTGSVAKARFASAVEEAKGAASAAAKEAQDRAGIYRDKLASKGSELTGQAKERAASLAEDGKTRASGALSGLSKIVADNASAIDDKLGAQYGDYARSAAQSIQDAAARIDAKDLSELGDDFNSFVRKSPALAVGIAAVAGFALARLFKGSED